MNDLKKNNEGKHWVSAGEHSQGGGGVGRVLAISEAGIIFPILWFFKTWIPTFQPQISISLPFAAQSLR